LAVANDTAEPAGGEIRLALSFDKCRLLSIAADISYADIALGFLSRPG
jgi:hypothetical protein